MSVTSPVVSTWTTSGIPVVSSNTPVMNVTSPVLSSNTPGQSTWGSPTTIIAPSQSIRSSIPTRGRGRGTTSSQVSQNLFSTVTTIIVTDEEKKELEENTSVSLPPLPFKVEHYVNDLEIRDLQYVTKSIDNEDILRYTEFVHLIQLDGEITVAQDHMFPYGAKIRGHRVMQIIKNMGKKGIVASGTNYGMGQVALAAACKYYGLSCKIFLTGNTATEMSVKSENLGADIVMNNFRLRDAKDASVLFARSSNNTYYWMEPGLADPIFMDALTENLRAVKSKYSLKPSEIWVAGGTGTFATCLCSAYPDITVNIVQVGLPIWKDLLVNKNYKLHLYTKGDFYTQYPGIVPYDSLSNYDAKIWDFRSQMQPGALIWNIY